jgi:RHS repeat-associated protein
VKPLYNGNIAETYWNTADLTRAYGYKYDNLNRLKDAIYQRATATTNAYNESLTYDKNGNITTLLRNGSSDLTTTSIDNLVYTYGSTNTNNQLMKVTDSSNKTVGFKDGSNSGEDYTYDTNGNMKTDLNKNITAITYNHLNLPTKITFGTAGNIVYIYDATGQKNQKIVNDNGNVTTTDYLNGYQYLNTVLQFFPTAEGYVEPVAPSSYKYVYQYKDHLGNVRLSYRNTGSTTAPSLQIQEENNYYPFGLKQTGYGAPSISSNNKYRYNSKEYQDELGLNWYSYGYRHYDPAIARWTTTDPLAEQTPEWSPYAFCNNNPLFFTDPDGRSASPIYDQEGTFMGTDDQGLQGKAIVMKKEDFTQGMKHEDAMKKDLAPNGGSEYYKAISDYGDYSNFYKHYNSLPNRPDYDGYLTKSEADAWWSGKSGQPLFVDQSKIELPSITTKDFDNKKGSSLYNNFIWGLSNTGKVYGTLKLTLLNANTGSVHLGGKTFMDEYDYKMDGRPLRNAATWVGRPGGENSGKNFFIHGYGQSKVPVKK